MTLLLLTYLSGMPTKGDPCPLIISIDPLDRSKRFVIDSSAQNVLNAKLTEKLKDADPKNPNTIQYAKEFIAKMLTELHKSRTMLY